LANHFLAFLQSSAKEKAAQGFGEDASNLIRIAPEFKDDTGEPKDVMTVFNSCNNVSRTYTVKYLFVINSCQAQAKDNLKSINIATHHQRLTAGQELYTTLDIGTKAIWEGKQ
jgi:hypothetical protein